MAKKGRYVNCDCREGECPPPAINHPQSKSYLDKYYSNRDRVQGVKK